MAEATRAILVVLVDDHAMLRQGLRSRLEQEDDIAVVGEFASAEEALSAPMDGEPSVIVLDIRLPGMSGLDALRPLRRRWPRAKVLLLSGYDYDQYVRAAARAGADGYLLKESPQDELVTALRTVAAGGAVLPPAIASKLMQGYRGRVAEDVLVAAEPTVRELEILEHVHEGLRNNEIARQMGISLRTVEAHVSSIIAKLGAHTRTEAVRVALERRLIR